MREGTYREGVPSISIRGNMFKRLLFLAALLIASCAGWFSISGIGQLFIGAPIAAMLMAGSLELGKLVTVSFVYRYWAICSRPLRAYFMIASVILMLITSTGVYGYLSAAYAKAAVGVQAVQNEVALISTRQKSIDGSIGRLEARAHSVSSVRTQQENRLDKLVGRRGLADQQTAIRQADKQLSDISTQISDLTHQRDSLETKKVEVQNNLSTNGKIGTFWYIAKSLGVELDFIVRWFILAIVLVLDPLSVTLIIAYNMINKHDQKDPEVEEPEVWDSPDWFNEKIAERYEPADEELPTAMDLLDEVREPVLPPRAPTDPQYRPTNNGGIDIS
jgi:hypothetical protein